MGGIAEAREARKKAEGELRLSLSAPGCQLEIVPCDLVPAFSSAAAIHVLRHQRKPRIALGNAVGPPVDAFRKGRLALSSHGRGVDLLSPPQAASRPRAQSTTRLSLVLPQALAASSCPSRRHTVDVPGPALHMRAAVAAGIRAGLRAVTRVLIAVRPAGVAGSGARILVALGVAGLAGARARILVALGVAGLAGVGAGILVAVGVAGLAGVGAGALVAVGVAGLASAGARGRTRVALGADTTILVACRLAGGAGELVVAGLSHAPVPTGGRAICTSSATTTAIPRNATRTSRSNSSGHWIVADLRHLLVRLACTGPSHAQGTGREQRQRKLLPCRHYTVSDKCVKRFFTAAAISKSE